MPYAASRSSASSSVSFSRRSPRAVAMMASAAVLSTASRPLSDRGRSAHSALPVERGERARRRLREDVRRDARLVQLGAALRQSLPSHQHGEHRLVGLVCAPRRRSPRPRPPARRRTAARRSARRHRSPGRRAAPSSPPRSRPASPTRSCRADCGSTPPAETADGARSTVAGLSSTSSSPHALHRVGGEDAGPAGVGEHGRAARARKRAHLERHRHVEQLLDRRGAQHAGLREQRVDRRVARRQRAGVRRRRARARARAPRLHDDDRLGLRDPRRDLAGTGADCRSSPRTSGSRSPPDRAPTRSSRSLPLTSGLLPTDTNCEMPMPYSRA